MSKDIYGAVNRHYGSEPDTERDEEAVTEWAMHELDHHGKCPSCKWGDAVPDAQWEAHRVDHAETCTPLRERVVAQQEADRE